MKIWFVKSIVMLRDLIERPDRYEIIGTIFCAGTYYSFYSSYLSVKC